MTQIRELIQCPDVHTDGLRVSGVRMSYGPVPVLHGVDLVVAAGTLTAVLGASGCGKTTLLRLIAGFELPETGSIVIAGREVAGPAGVLPPEHRRIGYVTQEGNLFPHLTVAANIAFGMRRRERRAGSPRVAELLELVGLDAGYLHRHPHELSGGQQQRVALARALAPRPGIVLLDEPFSALDTELRENTRRAVAAALAATGTTTVLVTHDQAEALSLADRVAVLRDGRIAQEATPAHLYRHPVDRAMAEFVGDVVALPATVREGTAHCALGALPTVGRPPDGPATVLIRPEQIAPHQGNSGVPAQVGQVVYHGHDAVIRLALDTGEQVIARVPGHQVPTTGSRIRLTVHGQTTTQT